jgi:hypothetical protein
MAQEKYPALEMPADGTHGNGSRSGTYYKIGARNDSAMPKVIDSERSVSVRPRQLLAHGSD